jgi:membrane protease YdiL (CAAX protease family)
VSSEKEQAMKRVIWFFVLACAFSWGLWFATILSAKGFLPFPFHSGPFGSFGPALAAIVVCLASGGKQAVADLLRPFRVWRVAGRCYLFAVLFIPATYLAAIAVYCLFARTLPGLPRYLDQWYLLFPLAPVILVLGGPLGEEIGWRGFAIPEMMKRYSPLTASLILAPVWFVWHLPSFWLPGMEDRLSSTAGFGLSVLAFAVLFTWLYVRTGRSLLLAVIFHTSINTVSFVLDLAYPALMGQRILTFSFIVLLLAFAGMAAVRMNGRVSAAGAFLDGSVLR